MLTTAAAAASASEVRDQRLTVSSEALNSTKTTSQVGSGTAAGGLGCGISLLGESNPLPTTRLQLGGKRQLPSLRSVSEQNLATKAASDR